MSTATRSAKLIHSDWALYLLIVDLKRKNIIMLYTLNAGFLKCRSFSARTGHSEFISCESLYLTSLSSCGNVQVLDRLHPGSKVLFSWWSCAVTANYILYIATAWPCNVTGKTSGIVIILQFCLLLNCLHLGAWLCSKYSSTLIMHVISNPFTGSSSWGVRK